MDTSRPSGVERRYLLSFKELQRETEALEAGSFTTLSDTDLKEKIGLIHTGFPFRAPVLPAGTVFFRAVEVDQIPTHRSRIGYPPAGVVSEYGRLNRPGEVMFYGGFHLFPGLLECDWKVKSLYAISGWLTTQPMLFNHLGYSRSSLNARKSTRELPRFVAVPNDLVRDVLIREWQGRVFTQWVPDQYKHFYRLPIALRDFAFLKFEKRVGIDPTLPDVFSGVIYPSVVTSLLNDNVAILPCEVDNKMALFEVALATLDSVNKIKQGDGSLLIQQTFKPYDIARPDMDGNLRWGQVSQIPPPNSPGVYSTVDWVGRSEFRPKLLPPK